MPDLSAASEHELIRRTIARNNQALDDRRYEDCAATFSEDGSIAGHHGRAAILEFMHSQRLGADPALQRRHVVTNIAIDLSGDQARVAICWCSTKGPEPWRLSAVGRYADRLSRQPDGDWLFAERQLRSSNDRRRTVSWSSSRS